ncbi:CDP-alcohol phosphatidyltransferase family protein [Aneurinibacillus sp. Ricciae_BoGa-3]|uniref:CDP-alcohol phosphatidyltransferase family protein n=1 Tax=Aneurinibacillus sp. Ricciae_BoGa-3 TaxID=3022697 RepID=UPI00234035E1|nr:CDP-alcohol phosphatidyltransferase family protein [Aneurinibacillus sp. Ricciae_BoGa-3]WCK52946.1 CDP-alcohol phosphatidyltransferase family protein [Aneurinibacillus sp. Ricciae_BoGa-3]
MLDTHARHLVQPVIGGTAKFLIKLGLSANQVTWIAFLLGVSTGFLLYMNHPYLAVIALWISGYLDAVDGSIARLKQKSTPWGTLLDITFDRIVELSVLIGLGAKFPEAQFMLLLLTASIVFSMTVFLTVGALTEKKGMKSFYYQAGLAERTEGFILFTFMILLPHWLLWITGIFLVVELFTALQRLMEARRILKKG